MVAVALPSLQLSRIEEQAVGELRQQLTRVNQRNQFRSNLYETKHSAEDLGISAPEGLPELVNAVIGWPGTVVDVLEERLDFQGWTGADELNLLDIARDNNLYVEASQGHLDSLIYGCGFVSVGRGGEGEPEVLVSVESTESATAVWDYRLRRAKSALSQTRDRNGIVILETLYLPDETIIFEHKNGRMVVAVRDRHNLGRVPVARLVNRQRASDVDGRSEITPAVVYLTDAAIRTMCGMEINREFYTTPKWSALNTDPEVFNMSEDNSAEENKRQGWKATAGNMNVVPPQVDEAGNPVEPKLHEFRPAPPNPYIDQVKVYAQLLATESGFPASYLGFATDNPPSADSIRQLEARLVKRAERRQTSFGTAWLEVARLALMIRDGGVDQDLFRQVNVKWRDAAIPTRAASADEAVKLIGAQVLPPDSSVTYDRIGLSQQEQQQLQADMRRSGVQRLVEQLRNSGNAGGATVPTGPGQPAGQ